MLYSKEKQLKKKDLYDYLHVHASSEQVHRLQKKGRVMLNGKSKK